MKNDNPLRQRTDSVWKDHRQRRKGTNHIMGDVLELDERVAEELNVETVKVEQAWRSPDSYIRGQHGDSITINEDGQLDSVGKGEECYEVKYWKDEKCYETLIGKGAVTGRVN